MEVDGRTLALTRGKEQSPVLVEPYDAADPNQNWTVLEADSVVRNAIGATTSPFPCLDLYYGRTTNGSPVHVWPLNAPPDRANQHWMFHMVEVPSLPPGSRPGGPRRITAAARTKGSGGWAVPPGTA
jgi:hypothetical protein